MADSVREFVIESLKGFYERLPFKEGLTKITYRDLKILRDGGNLVPGTWYRIIDYHTTVSPLITDVRSADHQFDVIVHADDARHLNENGYAAHHIGDTYFSACKLEAWELQYRLDNDKWSRVAGIFIEDAEDGHYMRKLGTVEVGGKTYILWDASEFTEDYEITRAVSEDDEISTELKGYDPETGEILDEGWSSSIANKFDVERDGKGTILMLKDEYGNQCPYDFKSIQFKRWAVTDLKQGRDGLDGLYMGVLNSLPIDLSVEDEDDFIWAYTFSSDATGSEDQADYSLDGTHFVYDNVLAMSSDAMNNLNNVVFYGENIYNNCFDVDCRNNSFGNGCFGNSFGSDCRNNSFGNNCDNNTFGNYCQNNTFGNGCFGNSFGRNCYGNSFKNSCFRNSFGSDCQSNSFESSDCDNLFGINCRNNSFGSSCQNNSFGNNCRFNSFGTKCVSNSFGNTCQYNSFGNYCKAITVFDEVLNCNVTGGTLSAYIKNAQILNGTAGVSAQNKLTITFTANKGYTQVAGLVNGTTLRIWIAEDTVTGPQTAVNNHIAVFDDATGKIIKDSGVAISDLSPDLVTPVTYSELVTLKTGGDLIPGMQYRITDYTCTTIQVNTQSAGHIFDIIVTADSETELNENARAAHHNGDTYFTNCDLYSWELKYCLENDTDRFAWADTTNGKGVIYYMKDEWNNECPYDFKNIKFQRWAVETDPDHPYLVVDNTENYHEYYYGAKDLLGNNILITATYGENTGYFYTFALKDLESSEWFDYTVVAHLGLKSDEGNEVACYNNHLTEATDEYTSGKGEMVKILNSIVFFNCYTDLSDTLHTNDYSYCNNNRFLGNCYFNTFGNNCDNNTFGNYCQNNTFGNICHFNTFGNYCQNNTFGTGCGGNSFGNGCQNNSFGNTCQNSSFGTHCANNSFEADCNANLFGNYCQNNIFGNHCQNNSFGNYCQNNIFGNYCLTITVFDGVAYCSVTGGSLNTPVKNTQILNGTKSTNVSNKLTITFTPDQNYTQVAGLNSSGVLKIWTPADLID